MEGGGAEGVASAVAEYNYMYTVISCIRGGREGGREGVREEEQRERERGAGESSPVMFAWLEPLVLESDGVLSSSILYVTTILPLRKLIYKDLISIPLQRYLVLDLGMGPLKFDTYTLTMIYYASLCSSYVFERILG